MEEKYNDKEKWTTYSSHSYDSSINGTKCITNFSLESLRGIETVTSENEAKAEELAPQDQYEETEKSELDLSNTQEKEESNKITILHTNDTHGRLKADNKIIV